MNKYKININKTMPSDEVINQKKNFNDLLGSFEELHKPHLLVKNRHKKRRTIQIIVMVVAVFLALFFAKESTENDAQDKSFIENLFSK